MNARVIVPGMVVEVFVGIFWHPGIVTKVWPGGAMVISNSFRRGGVVEESIAEFSGGRKMRVGGIVPSTDPMHTVARARSKIGTRYNLFTWNCEHFARWAHGITPESPQLQRFGAVVLGVGLLLAIVKKANAR